MSRAQAIWGAVEVSSKILDCADVGTCGMLSVITALEFFQHYFAKMGHRNTSCDPHLHQVIEQPILPTSREASAARAATSKRPYRRSGLHPSVPRSCRTYFIKRSKFTDISVSMTPHPTGLGLYFQRATASRTFLSKSATPKLRRIVGVATVPSSWIWD